MLLQLVELSEKLDGFLGPNLREYPYLSHHDTLSSALGEILHPSQAINPTIMKPQPLSTCQLLQRARTRSQSKYDRTSRECNGDLLCLNPPGGKP